MVQQIDRLNLTALRIGQASDELNRIKSTPYDLEVGFDIETTGRNPRVNQMVMVQLKPAGKKALIIDARGEDRGALHSALLPLLTDAKRTFVGQNLLFELHWLLTYLGFEVDDLRATFSDTMLRELVILGLGFGDAKKRGLAVNMHDIAERYGLSVHKEERSWFIDLDQRPEEWAAPFPQAQLEYGRQDVSVVHLISAKQQELIDEYGLQEVVDLEARVLPATAGMQHYGLAVDREKWLGIIAGIDAKAEELAAKLHVDVDVPVLEHRRQEWLEKAQPYQEWVKQRDDFVTDGKQSWGNQKGWGEEKKRLLAVFESEYPKPKAVPALKDGVNLNSSDQMQVAFRSRGHLVESVAEKVLTPLAAGDPVIQLYMDWKDYNTARDKYGIKYLEQHAPDGVIHPSINQVGAETGRFAFKEPNVQQVPSQGAGYRLREAIVSRPGHAYIDFDFSNIELRILADISGDPVMLAAFASNEDLHAKTAEFMFGLQNNPEYVAAPDKKEWTDTHNAVVGGKELNATTYRKAAKKINFLLLYGGGAGLLASELRINVSAARELMGLYRETYKIAVGWLKRQGAIIGQPYRTRGEDRVYSSTIAGRRRWFDVPSLKDYLTNGMNATNEEAQEARDRYEKAFARVQRQLANHVIQGTSAEITKESIAGWQERYNSPEMRLVCAVHDELLVECIDDPDVIAIAKTRLEECMREALRHFLKRVEPGKIGGEVAHYWKH